MWNLLPLSYAADLPPYQACPLLRAYYPPPTLNKSSDTINSFSDSFTSAFDDLVRTGKSDDFGDITPNTTSFSVVLFSGAGDGTDDPIFYSYHHTAPAAAAAVNVTSDTTFPLGTLTQLFTVYTWLVEVGDRNWGDPITKYLPELENSIGSAEVMNVQWSDVTIGTLAGHMAGIVRDSYACEIGKACDKRNFMQSVAQVPPLFLPDTTPIFSNAAFQLLAFALATAREDNGNASFADMLLRAVLGPLNMTQSTFISTTTNTGGFGEGLNASALGEQAAFSLLSSTHDLAVAGHAMLSSRLIPPATTRRWLQSSADTSNLRNGVGRPWEVYRAGVSATAPILDVFLKSGAVAQYSSYFGLAPDVDAGFAILAHEAGGRGVAADLNVYVDVVAEGLQRLLGLAAAEAAGKYAGTYGSEGDVAVFDIANDGPGFVVSQLMVDGREVRNEAAAVAGIVVENLDFRVYPTNVVKGRLRQFVAVFQDRNATVDMGTPTCITWMTVGALGPAVADRFIFELDGTGMATRVLIPSTGISLARVS